LRRRSGGEEDSGASDDQGCAHRPMRADRVSACKLVSRFRSSHHCAAASFANFGIEGH
jgi:hypothetical protein